MASAAGPAGLVFGGGGPMWCNQRFPPAHRCPSPRAALPRVLLAAGIGWAGLRVGAGYAHLCEAGSGWIEGGAILGTPLAAAWGVLCARRLWLGCAGAGLLLLAVDLLRDPYLGWAHAGMRW